MRNCSVVWAQHLRGLSCLACRRFASVLGLLLHTGALPCRVAGMCSLRSAACDRRPVAVAGNLQLRFASSCRSCPLVRHKRATWKLRELQGVQLVLRRLVTQCWARAAACSCLTDSVAASASSCACTPRPKLHAADLQPLLRASFHLLRRLVTQLGEGSRLQLFDGLWERISKHLLACTLRPRTHVAGSRGSPVATFLTDDAR